MCIRDRFHADHGNLATTALGTDATAWRAARAECFQQTEVGSGKALGVFPRYLLVPAELYDTALSILGYGEGMPAAYAPEALGRGFADPRPIPLVVPDWSDDNNWAYVVDPAVFPVIQMSYSQSPGGRRHPIPELFAVVSETSGLMFSNDILPIKVRDEFAPVSYTHLRAHETVLDLVCRLLLEKKNNKNYTTSQESRRE